MPRWKKRRWCNRFPGENIYKPQGVPMQDLALIDLEQDELEAMRLCDRDNLTQEEAGELMGISRGTVQRMLWSGRNKVVNFLLSGSALRLVPIQNHPYIPPERQDSRGGGQGRRRRRGGGR